MFDDQNSGNPFVADDPKQTNERIPPAQRDAPGAVFEAGATKLRCGVEAMTYDLNKTLPKEEKESLSYVTVDVGRVFCDASARLAGPRCAIASGAVGTGSLSANLSRETYRPVRLTLSADRRRLPLHRRSRKRCGSDLLNWGRGASPGYWG
jgi:hypothetical protein